MLLNTYPVTQQKVLYKLTIYFKKINNATTKVHSELQILQ